MVSNWRMRVQTFVYHKSDKNIIIKATMELPITDPPKSGQPLYNGHWLWQQLKLLLDSGQWTSCVLPTDQLCTTVPLITDKQETTAILHRNRGVAIAVLGHRCLMGRLLLRSSMQLIGLVDQYSVRIWQDGDHRAGSQRRQWWTDQQIWLPGVSVSVVHGVEVYF